MYYELTNTPTMPVSLDDAKAFLRVEHAKEDALITSLIQSAVVYGELYTSRDFSTKTWDGFFNGLCSGDDIFPYIELHRAPLQSIESVENSINGSYVAYSDFIEKKDSGYSRILFNGSIPSNDDTVAYNYKVSFTSGYSTLPDGLKTAILEHVSFLYENRGDVPSDMIKQIKSLYHQYRIIPLYGV